MDQHILSIVLLTPLAGLAVLLFLPASNRGLIRIWANLTSLAGFLVSLPLVFRFGKNVAGFQFEEHFDWIPSLGAHYHLGMDGISLLLVMLTTMMGFIATLCSWSAIEDRAKEYYAMFLLLQTGMIGVFISLDFFLFYVFWEVMLLPMYFLIGIWGGPRREYAAIKFFLFTLVGSVLMLVAILVLYSYSNVHLLSHDQLVACKVIEPPSEKRPETGETVRPHTFNMLALAQIGQLPDSPENPGAPQNPFHHNLFWGKSVSWWAFLLLLIGFIIKLPSVPFHTWLPDAHVEAPTPISMILAGVLLKMGGYGVIRICYPICPDAGYELAWLVCGLGTVSMVYGGLAAMAQKDFKRLVAYSSVSHMGYVLLGIGVWSATAGLQYNQDYWTMAMSGAMFQMIAHGISSAGMFFLVGVVYERVHHRNIDEFGGLFAKMPTYAGISMVIFFAALGLPGLCGFVGEFFVVMGTWAYSKALAVVAASVVILTAGYILWTIQRVYLGSEYKGPHGDALTPMSGREIAIAAPLVALAILFGVYPKAVLDYITPSVQKTVTEMKAVGEDVDHVAAMKAMKDAPPQPQEREQP